MKFNIDKFSPCSEGRDYYRNQPGFKTAWKKCSRGDWMLWLAKKLDVDERTLTLTKGYCARTVLHLMKDERSIRAVDAAISFGNGNITKEELAFAAADAAAAAAAYADAKITSNEAAYAAAAIAAYYAAANTAANAAANAAFYAAHATAIAAANAAYAARIKNQKITASICRKYLTAAVFAKIKEKLI